MPTCVPDRVALRSWSLGCALLAAITLPAAAQPPEHAGKGRDKHAAKNEAPAARSTPAPQPGAYFNDRNRDGVKTYYSQSFEGGKRCPPGLAKKGNGCQPPGQARKWQVGQPLPKDVVIYPVPQPVLVQLPPPPSGHKYVRVASDILLIAIGTAIVIDGIEGLSR